MDLVPQSFLHSCHGSDSKKGIVFTIKLRTEFILRMLATIQTKIFSSRFLSKYTIKILKNIHLPIFIQYFVLTRRTGRAWSHRTSEESRFVINLVLHLMKEHRLRVYGKKILKRIFVQKLVSNSMDDGRHRNKNKIHIKLDYKRSLGINLCVGRKIILK
jgi:hypothetical protein